MPPDAPENVPRMPTPTAPGGTAGAGLSLRIHITSVRRLGKPGQPMSTDLPRTDL